MSNNSSCLALGVVMLGAIILSLGTDHSKAFATETTTANKNVLPESTEQWMPEVPIVIHSPIPSDAEILFDGMHLNQWRHDKDHKPKWQINRDKSFTVVPGTGPLYTKESFCDIQLHIEWRSPKKLPEKTGQALGNSGIFLMGLYELQILDSYENKTYANGQAGAIYKQWSPLVNATARTGEWNVYDIIFKAPRFGEDGKLISPAYLTVLHNGVLIQNHVQIKGATTYLGQPAYEAHGCAPITLQDHNDQVSFRHIWLRNL